MASESPPPARPDDRTQSAVLLFTDICDSTALKARYGAMEYKKVVERHNRLFEKLAAEEEITLIKNTGDGYFARSTSVAAVVRFALRFQHGMRVMAWPGFPITTRVGIHAGEVVDITTLGQADVLAPAADLAARVMGLAVGGQILLTRWPFDEARHFVRMHPPVESGDLPAMTWMAHGAYFFKGCEDPVEVFEAGAAGIAPLVTPPDGEKAKRVIGAGEAISNPEAISRMRELENRRAKLESDVERLKAEERLLAEREWLVREKEVLDAARRDFASQENRRKEQLAAEQREMETMRQTVAQQQALLDEKQAEQRRLEAEIQSRAQGEAQKSQSEAESLRSELASRDAKLVEALHEREAEFRAREEKNLARVGELRREAEELQERLHAEAEALRDSELRQSQRGAEEAAARNAVKDTLIAEERRLDALRGDLEVRLAQWERGRKRRTLAMLIGVPLVILFAGIAAYVIKVRFVDISTLPGEQQWRVALEESRQAKSEKNWQALLNWCVTTDAGLRAKPEFAESLRDHQRELVAWASEAVHGILGEQKLPDGSSEQGRRLLLNLEKIGTWNMPPERSLAIAKLRMPEAAARGAGAEALEAYLSAVRANPKAAALLRADLDGVIGRLHDLLRTGKLELTGELFQSLGDVIKTDAAGGTVAERFEGELRAEEARRRGRMGDALQILNDTLALNPAWLDVLRPQVREILAQVAKLAPPEILRLSDVLRSAGDKWKNADAYLALANAEQDEKARADDSMQADRYGSMMARALVGRMMLDRGFETGDAALAGRGVAKLREAVEAGEAEAMVLLGEALAFGRGVAENPAEALELASRAEAKGHAEAFFLAARARLRLGVKSHDPAQFSEAAKALEKAVAMNLPSAAYFLYVANHNEVVNNPAQALAALENGALVRDKYCLFFLGWWLYNGQVPAERNQTRGRALIIEAANMGVEKAKEWLQDNPQ